MQMFKKLGIVATALAAMTIPAFAQNVDFYHDKANWQDAFNSVPTGAPAPVTATPYADTSTYQAAVRATLRTPSAPGIVPTMPRR